MLDAWAGERFDLRATVAHWGASRLDIDFRLKSDAMLAFVETRYAHDYAVGFDANRIRTIVKVSRPGRKILADATPESLGDIREFLTRMESGEEGF